jgi:GTP cyclohydrolase I
MFTFANGYEINTKAKASRMNADEIDEIDSGNSYTRIDHYNEKKTNKLAGFYSNIITELGEDITREGLEKTPVRAAKAMQFLLHGYDVDPKALIRSAMFKEEYQQMVIVKDIELYSLCEHHMLPFHGKAHVAYIPNGYITGLSKVARVVEAFARRLQVQERLTTQIRDCIQDTLNPLGVAVVIEAQHMCMQMRGIQKQNSVTTTSAFTGAFLKDTTRQEFIHLIGTKLR